MFNCLKNFFKPKVNTLNTIFIKKENILNNIKVIKNCQPKADFFPVLKSNAYWHWIKQILEIIKWEKFPYLAIDSFPEYQIIHKNSNFNILLLSETYKENYNFFDFKRTTFVIYNLETLKYLKNLNKKIKIHLFVNTWMNREWIQEKDLENFLEVLKNSKIELEWVMSHFHSADNKEFMSSIQQIIEFKKFYSKIEEKWFSPKYRHIWASSWVFRVKDDFFNAYRPWLILYWYNPFSEFWIKWKTDLLRPALSFEATIISTQDVKTWDKIWYSQKFKVEKESKVWVVSAWYYEFLSRKYSWHLKFSWNWKYVTQFWIISMNMSNILTEEEIKVWDKIQIINDNFWAKNSLNNFSKTLNVSIYELLVKLEKWIKRKIV